MLDFEHSLPFMLLRAREGCMTRFRPILTEQGLTEQQWRVIRALAEDNGLESSELAERTMILKPSMTGIIDRLERDGLVGRRKDRHDGRKTCVWLTRKARRLYERIIPLVEAEYAQMKSSFSEDSWQDLFQSLDQLIHLNGKIPEPEKE